MRWWNEVVLDLESLKLTNDPDDPGKQTFAGISRPNQPNWPGWAAVDRGDLEMAQRQAMDWYSQRWHWLTCHKFRHEGLALKLFDQSILFGAKRAVTWLQESVGLVNDPKEAMDPVVDGLMGPQTRGTANAINQFASEAAQVLMGQPAINVHLINDTGKQFKFLSGHLIRAARVYR